jgi:hypothetical protein
MGVWLLDLNNFGLYLNKTVIGYHYKDLRQGQIFACQYLYIYVLKGRPFVYNRKVPTDRLRS